MDQMYIEQDFEIEAEHQDLVIVGRNDEEEMITLELIPANVGPFVLLKSEKSREH